MKLILAVAGAGMLLFTSAFAESLLPASAAVPFPTELRIQCQACNGAFQPANCPFGTIFVSASDPAASFTTIQAAIDSLPDDTSAGTILVGAGMYHEQLNITRQGALYVLGQNGAGCRKRATVYYAIGREANAASTNPDPNARVIIHNIQTAVVLVAPPPYRKNLSQTAPPGRRQRRAPDVLATSPAIAKGHRSGCLDFRMYDIDIDQQFGPKGVALAIAVVNSKASFYGTGAFGFQDTVFIGHNASAFFLNSIIKGTVDFVYGSGTAVLFNCTLASRVAKGAGGSVTAWRKTRVTDNDLNGAQVPFIALERLRRADDIDPTINVTSRVSLGRPWGNNARTVYLHTWMEDHILPAGFSSWLPEDPRLGFLFFAEYNSSGPGANLVSRAAFPPGTPMETPVTSVTQLEHILTWHDARHITFPNVFHGDTAWVDAEYDSDFGRGLPQVHVGTATNTTA
ncbi:BQ2448_5237 [Microbotryum intermedium]|uniref:pectinesterase n=1 Tax=Microbotryum intermedium TaxID=269621 RepID=A0A238F980_9BASI|nr:BQ2448_5237 [Microbotryum intermedium]